MVTWVAVVILSVDLGLAVGVVFSMMTVVCRTQRVQCLALGLAEGTELYRPLEESHKLLKVPGLCILRYPTPLYFGTRGQFRRILEWHLGLGEGRKVRSLRCGRPGDGGEGGGMLEGGERAVWI
uniref:Solute carrier family 26 member 10 n=1 Tax=Panthera leo TaxID=9689 RepID=A0A8C8WZP7_PANLE